MRAYLGAQSSHATPLPHVQILAGEEKQMTMLCALCLTKFDKLPGLLTHVNSQHQSKLKG